MKRKSIHVLMTEMTTHGGMQRYNLAFLDALEAAAGPAGLRTRCLSLNDPPGRSTYTGFAGNKPRFTLAALLAALWERPQIVILGHVHYAPLAIAYRLLVPRVRLYAVAHGKEVEPVLPRLLRFGLRSCTRVFAVSQSTRSLLEKQQGVRADRTEILYYGFPAPEAREDAAPPVTGGSPGRLTLLSVSRLAREDRYKGIDVTIRALQMLRVRIPGLCYVVVGDGNDRAWLEALAQECGVTDHVRFLGHVTEDELARLYEECDVFALPSTHEGLGIVYLEAMARGRPVVGVWAGGVADVVVHEANGLLVKEQTSAAVAEAIRRLFEEPEFRARLGAWGGAHTISLFSPQQMAQSLHDVLFARPGSAGA